jgi:hypothetical protein
VPMGRTKRIHDPCWTYLPRRAVRALFPEWRELDMSAAHLCIFERVCRDHGVAVPMLASLLNEPAAAPDPADGPMAAAMAESRNDVWRRTCPWLGVGPEHRKDVECLVTEMLYGAGNKRLEDLVTKMLYGAGDELPDECLGEMPQAVLAAPLVQELLKAARALAALAKAHGYLRGVGGQKREHHGNPYGTIGVVCTDFEMELIGTLYEVAQEPQWRGCWIVRHMHDGVDFVAPSELVGGFTAACSAAIDAKAAELGVKVRLGCGVAGFCGVDVTRALAALRSAA